MIRAEAVLILKAFMDNPLFSDEHKAAFNIAIHDIEKYHDWNINELILVPKDNSEYTQDHAINKAYADGYNSALEDIQTEIQRLRNCSCSCSDGIIDDVEDIIDNHISRSEVENGNDD